MDAAAARKSYSTAAAPPQHGGRQRRIHGAGRGTFTGKTLGPSSKELAQYQTFIANLSKSFCFC